MVVTTKEEDAVLQTHLVMKEKVIVMDLMMAANMTVMLDVREILYVEVIIVKSLVLTSMKKMIVVRSLLDSSQLEVHRNERVCLNSLIISIPRLG